MSTIRRRLVSISGLFIAALLLLVLIPIWVPLSVLLDLIRGRVRLPIARLLLFALGGVTLLERSLIKRREGYEDYVARTSPFVPRPPKRH